MSFALPAQSVADQEKVRLVELIRVAEDARGLGPSGLTHLLEGLRHTDSEVRIAATLGIGRLERPDLVGHLLPLLTEARVRDAAAAAVAQSLRGLASAPMGTRRPDDRRLVDSVFAALRARALAGGSMTFVGAAAQSIGRLPYDDQRQARVAEGVLLELASIGAASSATGVAVAEGVAHGLYDLARARRTLGDLSSAGIAWLDSHASYGSGLRPNGTAGGAAVARVRRLVWLTLAAAGHRDSRAVREGVRDPDVQVRRLVLLYLRNVSDTGMRRDLLRVLQTDTAFSVRYDWVRIYRELSGTQDCEPLIAATRDPNPHVRLAAIDALGDACVRGSLAVDRLRQLIDSGPNAAVRRRVGEVSWHARAHALLALARADARAALPLLRRNATHPVWQVRMYAARGAAAARDTAILAQLAFDSVGNVREVALEGLALVSGHAADLLFVRALRSVDYHVVLAAARALKGAPLADSVVPAAIAALDRLSAERRETSRDPRLELLARIEELGSSASIARLVPYARDFDPAVAARAAAILNRWSPGAATHLAAPARLPAPRESLGLLHADSAPLLRVTMSASSGGGVFVLRLRPKTAPLTGARVLRLVASGYYNGLTWHRMAPNFVLQGGSPAMNEYVGDGPFMRDEVGQSHLRGTLGISTRGRDTGDAQWFINLVDNYRLDHEYTVFAEVESGMDVVDGILEGDVMELVTLIRGR